MSKKTNKPKINADLEINLGRLLKDIVHRLWLIILVGAIFGAAAFGSTKLLIKPIYRCGFTAYVNNKQVQKSTDYLTSSDVTASQQIVQTYSKILSSSRILTESAKSIGMDPDYNRLKTKVSTEIQDETEIISVYVTDTDPMTAYKFAEAIATTAPGHMADIVEGSSMKIVDYPEYNNQRYAPSYFRYGLIGFFVGVLLVIVWLVIRFLLDDTVKSESDIENRFPIPILGVIPDASRANEKNSSYYYNYYEYEQKSEHKNEQENEKE